MGRVEGARVDQSSFIRNRFNENEVVVVDVDFEIGRENEEQHHLGRVAYGRDLVGFGLFEQIEFD